MHKNSGAFWQKFCNEQCLKAGFRAISDNWPCAYWNEENQQFLIVYVDDMKLAGPSELMEEAWRKLGEGIGLGAALGTGTELARRTCLADWSSGHGSHVWLMLLAIHRFPCLEHRQPLPQLPPYFVIVDLCSASR